MVHQRRAGQGDNVRLRQHIGRPLGRQVTGAGAQLQHPAFGRCLLHPLHEREMADDGNTTPGPSLQDHLLGIDLGTARHVHLQQRIDRRHANAGPQNTGGAQPLGQFPATVLEQAACLRHRWTRIVRLRSQRRGQPTTWRIGVEHYRRPESPYQHLADGSVVLQALQQRVNGVHLPLSPCVDYRRSKDDRPSCVSPVIPARTRQAPHLPGR